MAKSHLMWGRGDTRFALVGEKTPTYPFFTSRGTFPRAPLHPINALQIFHSMWGGDEEFGPIDRLLPVGSLIRKLRL